MPRSRTTSRRRPRGLHRRDAALLLRVSPQERAVLHRAAAKLGVSTGSMVRDAGLMMALRVIHGDERYSDED